MNRESTSRRLGYIILFGASLTTAGAADANLVLNGGFETVNGGGPNFFLDATHTLADWAVSGGIAAVYSPGSADTIGATQFGTQQIYLWGPGNPSPGGSSANGLTATSPAGGNYLASDSDKPYSGTYTQTISGLTIGDVYALTFFYGAAQFRSPTGSAWNGDTYSQWTGTIGAATFATPVLSISSHGFSGWQSFTLHHTATAASEVLSFLAVGGPGFMPPVALLDGVQLNAVPEPTTYSIAMIGILGLLAFSRHRSGS
ncbi:MAG: PEP-CTERM sorting domain-containing protein [Proteobacteria bacterium]|nr:PEP-CTERM sorting domain-containing protein [Pseudomonadota bacterium]